MSPINQEEESMRRLFISMLLLSSVLLPLSHRAEAAEGQGPVPPSIERQLAKDKVVPGSALESLIYANQDFSMLRPAELRERGGLPLWLRVYWRKGHPEMVYSEKDPTGGYPHVLKEMYEWMLTHQDLQPGLPDADVAPPMDKVTVGSNLRISGAQTSARSESDIRINFFNPTQVIAASNAISSGGTQAQFYSSNGGATWGQTSLPLASTDSFHSDPAVDWTSDGTAWAVTLGIKGNTLKVRAYKSTTGGATWTFDTTISGSQRSTDKELMWADHSATSAFKNTIYVCWHNGLPAYVNRRTSTGWAAAPIQVSGAESTGTAIGCDVKTNSAGDAFVFWPTTGNSRIVVAKSVNGGASWGTPKVIATSKDSYDIGIPSFANRRALIYTSGGAFKDATRNNVYVTWTDLSGNTGCTAPANEPGTNAASACKTRIWFSRSTDGGTTWSAPVKINDQASNNDQFNQWLAVDETTGNIGVMYYDTVNDATRKKTDVYFQLSTDNGVTWGAATKVTTALTDETIAGADSGNQYGDYNSLSGWANKFFPSWTDRRSGAKEEIWTAPVNLP
jgi:hypothetical protein